MVFLVYSRKKTHNLTPVKLPSNLNILLKVSDAIFQLPDHVLDSLRIRRDLGLQRGYAYSFEFIADVNEMEKHDEHAVQPLAAAETLRARIGAPVEQVNQKENENALRRLRAQLGEVVYELAWAKGATMTTEQAIALS